MEATAWLLFQVLGHLRNAHVSRSSMPPALDTYGTECQEDAALSRFHPAPACDLRTPPSHYLAS